MFNESLQNCSCCPVSSIRLNELPKAKLGQIGGKVGENSMDSAVKVGCCAKTMAIVMKCKEDI